MKELYTHVQEARRCIQKAMDGSASIAVILGTGLGAITERAAISARMSYGTIPHFPQSTVESHKGTLSLGSIAGKRVYFMEGRFHYYEGYQLSEVTFPVRVMKALGVRKLIITNAAGGMNPEYNKGDLVLITDHINPTGLNPLIGVHDDRFGPRFPDMCEPYSPRLVTVAEHIAQERKLSLKKGVYVWTTGPCLETKAEYKFMRMMGADLVGMSTVPEVIVGVQEGLEMLAISCITDLCDPENLHAVNIDDIIKTAEAASPKMDMLVEGIIEKM